MKSLLEFYDDSFDGSRTCLFEFAGLSVSARLPSPISVVTDIESGCSGEDILRRRRPSRARKSNSSAKLFKFVS